jgi:hypothetical protein
VSVTDEIRGLLRKCTPEERQEIFELLRQEFPIHPLEGRWNTKAEVILEAINRSPDLTQRGLRGIIAEAAFAIDIIGKSERWRDITPMMNLAYDSLVEDDIGQVRVQIKLQRRKAGEPMITKGIRLFQSYPADMFVVETQKTRGGKDSAGEDTRPYRYGEFDILGVSLHPSTQKWTDFAFTVADWLIPDPATLRYIHKLQPVSPVENEDWTRDFDTCVEWFRSRRRKTICEGLIQMPRLFNDDSAKNDEES